jgi:hypothetical protein
MGAADDLALGDARLRDPAFAGRASRTRSAVADPRPLGTASASSTGDTARRRTRSPASAGTDA